MNELLTLGLLGAAAYIAAKQSSEPAEPGASRTLSTEEVQQNTPVQAKIAELQSNGELVTAVQEVVTPSQQKVTLIVAPTPGVPNRGVVLDPNDLARINGRYIPQVTLTQDLLDQMAYAGYSDFDTFIRAVANYQVGFWGPAADRIKFSVADWEYWRTGFFDPNVKLTQLATSPLTTMMTHPEYTDLLYKYGLAKDARNGIENTGTRLSGLGCSGCAGLGCTACPANVWAT